MTAIYVLLGLINGYFICLYRVYLVAQGQRLIKRFFPHTQYSTRHITAHFNSLFESPNDNPSDAFKCAVPLTSQTVDVHFVMGRLLRSQGDTAQAIAVHQQLAVSPLLNTRLNGEAQLALAEDYLHAGMLDRAEAIYKSLSAQASTATPLKVICLNKLRALYEKMQDWQQAIAVAHTIKGQVLHTEEQKSASLYINYQVNYCCELALQDSEQGDMVSAASMLATAKRYNASHPRIVVVELHMLLQQGNINEALAVFDSNTIAVSILSLEQCLQAYFTVLTQQPHAAYEASLLVLSEKLIQLYNDQPLVLLLYYRIQVDALLSDIDTHIGQVDIRLVDDTLSAIQTNNTLIIFRPLLPFILTLSESALSVCDRDALNRTLLAQVASHLEKNNTFECRSCGYSQRDSQWHCPACQAWDTFIPHCD